MAVDLLAIAAHRDDVELTCAGTLLKAVDAGYRTGILDLTAGESGTRGSASLRGDEAAQAAACSVWLSGETPAARCPSPELRRIPRNRGGRDPPLPPAGRDPPLPHRPASRPSGRQRARPRRVLLAGLARYDAPARCGVRARSSTRWRIGKTRSSRRSWWTSARSSSGRWPAIRCYASQFDGAKDAGEIFPTGQDLYALVETQNAHYGSLIRGRFGEPFFTHETMAVDDVVALGVQSM